MQTAKIKDTDGTITFTITIPWQEIQKTYDATVDDLVKSVEIKGFRKGKAPKNLAEKELKKTAVYEEVIRQLVPKAYSEAIRNHAVAPIMQPDITLVKAKENEDWVIQAVTSEKPVFSLGEYKKTVEKAKGELKKDDLWLPGKEVNPEKEDKTEDKRQKTLNSILESLIRTIEIVIPAVLVKNDVDKRLSTLVDDIRGLGLTIESYCKSKNTNPEALRAQYEAEAKQAYKLEFLLEQIADDLKIVVDDKEIDTMIEKTQDPKEKQELSKNRYMLAHLIRRQKTLDRLLSL